MIKIIKLASFHDNTRLIVKSEQNTKIQTLLRNSSKQVANHNIYSVKYIIQASSWQILLLLSHAYQSQYARRGRQE